MIDTFLLASLAGLVLTEQTVVFFHLAFLGVLLSTLRLPLGWLALRAVVVGAAGSLRLVRAVAMGRAFVEELWEIPLMGFILVIAYVLRLERDEAQRRVDEERGQAQQRVDEGRFRVIAAVAHDIRNTLTSAAGFAEVIKEDAGFTAEERREMIGLVADATLEAHEMIDDLLLASRVQAGELEVAAEPVDVMRVTTLVIDHYQEPGNPIPVSLLVEDGNLACIADEARLRQILRNLLTNARRYGGSHIEVRVGRDESAVLVQVIDDGAAIHERERKRIFEPFAQSAGTDRPVESVGLGLYTSRRLARLMGGDISYRHEKGTSIFELRLPVAEHESQRDPLADSTGPTAPA